MNILTQRDIPRVEAESDINEVIAVMARAPHTRLVYVTDKRGRLLGTITVGSLLRHLFPYHYEGKVHSRGILRTITAEKAHHVMDRKNIQARPDESVDQVLQRMAETGVKELAVVDEDGVILADITAVDLLKFCQGEE